MSSTPQKKSFAYVPSDGSGSSWFASAEIQELWLALERRRWTSIVLVPADDSVAAGPIAEALEEIGTQLRRGPVTAIVADAADTGALRPLADLQPWLVQARGDAPRAAPGGGREDGTEPKIVLAVRSLALEPLGATVARSADGAIVCARRGVTRLAAVKRTIELLGADHVLGVLLVR